MGSVDKKYDGHLVKVSTGEEVTDFIIFRARDDVVPHMLKYYGVVCGLTGCDKEHLEAIKLLATSVDRWRRQHQDLCHLPDTKLDELQAKLTED